MAQLKEIYKTDKCNSISHVVNSEQIQCQPKKGLYFKLSEYPDLMLISHFAYSASAQDVIRRVAPYQYQPGHQSLHPFPGYSLGRR